MKVMKKINIVYDTALFDGNNKTGIYPNTKSHYEAAHDKLLKNIQQLHELFLVFEHL